MDAFGTGENWSAGTGKHFCANCAPLSCASCPYAAGVWVGRTLSLDMSQLAAHHLRALLATGKAKIARPINWYYSVENVHIGSLKGELPKRAGYVELAYVTLD
jgi:hypothetical protein